MAKQMAFLEYMFLFDPNATWNHLADFERDLADFFKAYGLEAQILNAIGGQPGKRIMHIKNRDKLNMMIEKGIPLKETKKVKDIGPSKKLKRMAGLE